MFVCLFVFLRFSGNCDVASLALFIYLFIQELFTEPLFTCQAAVGGNEDRARNKTGAVPALNETGSLGGETGHKQVMNKYIDSFR